VEKNQNVKQIIFALFELNLTELFSLELMKKPKKCDF